MFLFLNYVVLLTRLLLAHGVVSDPTEEMLLMKGKISAKTLEMSSSNVRDAAQEVVEKEEQDEVDERTAFDNYDMAAYFQYLEDHLND